MKTDQPIQAVPVFPQSAAWALAKTRRKLQQVYEQAYPALREIIRLILDEEEARALELLPFPHLFLPDLVEEHLAKLNLELRSPNHSDVLVRHDFTGRDTYQPAFSACA